MVTTSSRLQRFGLNPRIARVFVRKATETFISFVAGPLFGAVTTLAILMAGAMASFFTNEIKDNSSFALRQGHSLSWTATGFWAVCLFAGLCFFGTQWAQARQTRRTNAKLESIVARLRTLPSEDYLPSYREAFRQAGLLSMAALLSGSASRDEVSKTIQAVLRAIVETARSFDSADNVSVYSASVMLFRSDAAEFESANPVYQIDGMNDSELAGFLELIPALTVASSPTIQSRENVSLVLPIPRDQSPLREESGHDRFRILPGAPWAYVFKSPVCFVEMASFYDSLRDHSSLDHHNMAKVRAYFDSGPAKEVRSFASFPILEPVFGGTGVIAVLNLHSSEPGLLEDNGPELFAPLLEPFQLLLSLLIVSRSSPEATEPTARANEAASSRT